MQEPRLTEEDRRIWRRLTRAALAWSRKSSHRRAVDRAADVILAHHRECPDAYIGWSAGKDSTALTHLACVELGMRIDVMSIKDDLDFPGEREYVERLGREWDLRLDVIEPGFSLLEWLAAHPPEPGEDIHGRATRFSDEAFYGLIDEYVMRRGCADAYLGLRADESRHRRLNFWTRGHRYRKRDGACICQPLATWKALDVYAYLMSRDIDLLPVYKCVRMTSDPMSVRKSWWLPGTSGRHGAGIWLRMYYPSLFATMKRLLPLHGAALG